MKRTTPNLGNSQTLPSFVLDVRYVVPFQNCRALQRRLRWKIGAKFLKLWLQ